jgi:hypothetical protein
MHRVHPTRPRWPRRSLSRNEANTVGTMNAECAERGDHYWRRERVRAEICDCEVNWTKQRHLNRQLDTRTFAYDHWIGSEDD